MTGLLFDTVEPPEPVRPVPAASPGGGANPSAAAGMGAGGAPTPPSFDFEPGSSDPGRDINLSRIFTTSRAAAAHTSFLNSELLATQDAAEMRLRGIREATGADLLNPYHALPMTGDELQDPYAHPQDRAALTAYAADHPDYAPGRMIDTMGQTALMPYRAAALQNALAELARQHPEKAGLIGADRSFEEDGRRLALQSARDAAEAGDDSGGRGFMMQLAGGMAASVRDPVQVAGLLLSGGGLKATTMAGQMIEGSLRQAAVNAGLSAVEQPAVQDWRATLGLEHGLTPSLEDVGMAALFGAIPGAVGGALHPRHIPTAAAAMAGDGAAARELRSALPREAAPELHAAVESLEHDHDAAPPMPPGLPEQRGGEIYGDAVRFAEDRDFEPLPETAVLPRKGVSAAAAERELEGLTPPQQVEKLRGDLELAESALASHRPDIEQAGYLSHLSGDAWAAVQRGDVTAEQGRHIAATVPDPYDHMSYVRDLQQRQSSGTVLSGDAARLAISQEMEHRALGEAQARILGREGSGDAGGIATGAALPARQIASDLPGALQGGAVDVRRFSDAPTSGQLDQILSEAISHESAEADRIFGADAGQAKRLMRSNSDKAHDQIEALVERHGQEAHDFAYGTNGAKIVLTDGLKELRSRIGHIEAAVDDAARGDGAQLARELAWVAPKLPDVKAHPATHTEQQRIAVLTLARAVEDMRAQGVDPMPVLQGAVEYTGARVGGDRSDTHLLMERMSGYADRFASGRETAPDASFEPITHQPALDAAVGPKASGDAPRRVEGVAADERDPLRQSEKLTEDLQAKVKAAEDGSAAREPAGDASDTAHLVPVEGAREGDVRMMARDEILNEAPREELLGRLVRDCAV